MIAGVEVGLGFTLAKKSAKENMTVALIARNKGQLQSTVLEIEATGGKAYAFRADMKKQEEIIAAFKEIHLKLGITNILIYNATSK